MFIFIHFTMLDFTLTIFVISFCTTNVISKLNDKNEPESELGISNPKEIEESVPLHESYKPKHKYKLDTSHQEFKKRFADDDNYKKVGKQCAIMYKNNEPVGILQPFEESYRFLPIQGEASLVEINRIPAKRKSVVDILYPAEFLDDSEIEEFSDDRYPSVFAKFKIDSKMMDKNAPTKKKTNFKRDLIENKKLDPVKVYEESSTAHQGIDDRLKSILDDMGLIDEYPNQEYKRDVEDENLEMGTNKISLIKDSDSEREKRRDAEANKLVKRSQNLNDMPVLECTTNQVIDEHVEDYEKRVEREIRDKILELKHEVTEEIENLRRDQDAMREKRQVATTLMDEETNDINPTLNLDEIQRPLVRRKRDAEDEDNEIVEEIEDENAVTTKNFNEEPILKRDTNNAVKADNKDYQEVVNDELENTHSSQMKRKSECTCNKNNADCKCIKTFTIDKSLFEPVTDSKAKFPVKNKKESNKQCTCDKSGRNCKCDTLKETIPSLTDDSEYEDYNDSYDADGISAINEDSNNYDYEEDDKSKKRAVKARKSAVNKPMESGQYFVDFRPVAYRIPRRKKRENFMYINGWPYAKYGKRVIKEENNLIPRHLIDMNDEDIFGALPQNFDGELQRYKRIRRNGVA